jgi:hypothetical protein
MREMGVRRIEREWRARHGQPVKHADSYPIHDGRRCISCKRSFTVRMDCRSVRKTFLFCHSVELAMKAYLLATGSSIEDVEDLRHDLKIISNLCSQRGLVQSHARAETVLDMIAPVHKQHLLRYKEPGGVMMPNDTEFNEFLSSLLADIWPTVHKAESTLATKRN